MGTKHDPVAFYKELHSGDVFHSPTITTAVREAARESIAQPKKFHLSQQQVANSLVDTCQSMGPKARGHISFFFANGGGHSIAFENDKDGHVVFHDTQLAHVIDWADSGKNGRYFKQMLCNNNPLLPMTVTRTDNATPDYQFLRKAGIVKNVLDPAIEQGQRTAAGMAITGGLLAAYGGYSLAKSYKKKKEEAKNADIQTSTK
jgi:hypothetical protein